MQSTGQTETHEMSSTSMHGSAITYVIQSSWGTPPPSPSGRARLPPCSAASPDRRVASILIPKRRQYALDTIARGAAECGHFASGRNGAEGSGCGTASHRAAMDADGHLPRAEEPQDRDLHPARTGGNRRIERRIERRLNGVDDRHRRTSGS